MAGKIKTAQNLEYLLGLVGLALIFALLSLNMSLEIKDPDIWLHLTTGRYIWEHKSAPCVDPFSFTIGGAPWIAHSWLAEVFYYLIFRWAGPDGLLFSSAAVVSLAFLILFFTVYRGRQNLTLILGLFFITVLASQTRFNIRPENFSLLYFSLYLLALFRLIRTKWVLILPLVQAAWVNSHGFFILGPLSIGIFLLNEKIKRNRRLKTTQALDNASYQNLKDIFLLVCLACFINPYGLQGALYPFKVGLSSGADSGLYYRFIQELLPVWRDYKVYAAYFVLAALTLASLAINYKKISFAILGLWLFFLVTSLAVNRNIIFFNFFSFALAADYLSARLTAGKSGPLEEFFGKSLSLLKYALLILIIAYAARLDNSFLKSSYYIFPESRSKSRLLGIAAGQYPQKAADFILSQGLADNTFHLFNYGSYLIYRFFPQKKVFIDGRTELYGEDFFRDYRRILNADEEVIKRAFEKYDINTVLLFGHPWDIGELASYFYNQAQWVLVYFDADSLVFLKNSPRNKETAGRLKVNLQQWTAPPAEIERIGLRSVLPGPYLKRAWLFTYLGLPQQALKEAAEAEKIMPSASEIHNIRAKIYLEQKNYGQAYAALRLAYTYYPQGIDTLKNLGKFYLASGKSAKAVSIYKELVRLNPYFDEGYALLGEAYQQTHQPKLAAQAMQKAVKLNPFNQRYVQELKSWQDSN
jgi:tetratricopeptide (TPR) repeat protein